MHTDLSPHLHSDKCNEIIQALSQCHADHPLRQLFGICNSLDTQMVQCLKQERLARRQRNLEKSRENQKKLQKLMSEDTA